MLPDPLKISFGVEFIGQEKIATLLKSGKLPKISLGSVSIFSD